MGTWAGTPEEAVELAGGGEAEYDPGTNLWAVPHEPRGLCGYVLLDEEYEPVEVGARPLTEVLTLAVAQVPEHSFLDGGTRMRPGTIRWVQPVVKGGDIHLFEAEEL